MIALSIPPLFLLGYISFNITKQTLVRNHIQTNVDRLKTSSDVADLLFKNLINVNRLILANDELRQELRESSNSDLTGNSVIDIVTANRLQNVVVSNLIDTVNIDSICLFDNKFHSVCYGRMGSAGVYGSEGTRNLIERTDWYRQSKEAKGKEVFFSYNVLEETSGGNSFSSVKLLKDPDRISSEPLGLLVINIKKSLFETIIHESDDNRFMVLDSLGAGRNIVYDTHSKEKGRVVGQNPQTMISNLMDSGYIVSRFRNPTTGWTLIHLVKASTLLKDSTRIGAATTLIASFMALLALLLSFLMSGTITRPLLQLKKMMVDWANGIRNLEGNFDSDEIGVIGETFKRVAWENKQLNDRLTQSKLKTREAELRALQAQIKPHFLYNTLDSIYWMAELNNNKEIAQMSISLSESFKLSLNKGKEMIPVFKELKHIEHYMNIQNIRYNNRFQYIEDVEPSLMSIEILKLLLQPLIENAIYHGLEPKLGEGTVRLVGRLEGEFVIFSIEDNGVGMDNLAVTEEGYGLQNVRERLDLYYGADSSFSITSYVGVGTTIEIRFRHNHGSEG